MPYHYGENNNGIRTNLHTSGGEYVCSTNNYPGCGAAVDGTYVGPMHYHPDKGYMAGAEHSEQSHPLLERVNYTRRNNMPGHYGNGNGNNNRNNGQMNGRNTRRMPTNRATPPNRGRNPMSTDVNQATTRIQNRMQTANGQIDNNGNVTPRRRQGMRAQMSSRPAANTGMSHHTGYEYYDDGTPYIGNIHELINFNGIYYTSTNGVRTTDSRMVVLSNEPGLGGMRPPTTSGGCGPHKPCPPGYTCDSDGNCRQPSGGGFRYQTRSGNGGNGGNGGNMGRQTMTRRRTGGNGGGY